MSNMKTAIAACAGTIALACTAIPPAAAADMPPYPEQYSAPQYEAPAPERYVEERYTYSEPAPAYRPPALVPIAPAPPPVVAYQPPPPPVAEPAPYYERRRVTVERGYSNGPGPYDAGYGYDRGGYDRGYDYDYRR